ncbi:MAG: D-alanyl-D-alanine carboxypeptidase [Hyphomicrobiales bacterium]|nr:D-alanyl-D-alanine carboxypeptidase [Hyphomicrobiales bacterium]
MPKVSRILALALCLAAPVRAQTIQVGCQQAALMDAESRAFLYERAADELVSPASTVKVLTAEIVFQQLKLGRIHLDDTFDISEHAWRTGGAPSRGSSMFASLKSHVRVEDLIRGMVIDSGNDAAIALAEGIAGSEEAFVTIMNKRARELGMTRSRFANAWGKSDPQQKVTMREMVNLANRLIATYPDEYKYFGEKDFTWNKITQTNRNPLLLMNIGADGLKTGNIDEGGFAIVGSAVENGQRLIVSLNGCKTASERAEDARRLLLWGFRAFDVRTFFQPGDEVGSVKTYGAELSDAPVVARQPVKIFIPRGSSEKISAKIVYEGPVQAPIKEGAEIARLKVMRGATSALDIPLYAARDIAVGGLPHRAFDALYETGAAAFRKYVLRK